MKFDMGADTLTVLGNATSSSHDDLGGQVRQLAAAADPLRGSFNGAGRAAFDRFKYETDSIATELNAALAAVLGGIQGQDRAWVEGEQQMTDETNSLYGSTNFDSARFGARA